MPEEKVSQWEYINPVHLGGEIAANVASPYISPWQAVVYGPWRQMANGRVLLPGILPQWAGQGVAGSAWRAMPLRGTQKTMVGKGIAKFGKFTMFGQSFDMGDDARRLADIGVKEFRREVARGIPGVTPRVFGPKGALPLEKELRKAAVKRMAQTRGVTGLTVRAGMISLGRIVNPIMTGIAVVQAGLWAGEMAFKGLRTTTSILERVTTDLMALELGGSLSEGFLSQTAATERQRALQAIQASHLSGRRMLGNEAQLVH